MAMVKDRHRSNGWDFVSLRLRFAAVSSSTIALLKRLNQMSKLIKMVAAAAAVTIFIPPSTAVASDSDGSYEIYGVGGNPCHAFLTAIGRDREDYVNWLTGFLTASNAMLSGTKDITPGSSAAKFLSIVWKQCRAFHDIPLSNAATTIATRLHDRLLELVRKVH